MTANTKDAIESAALTLDCTESLLTPDLHYRSTDRSNDRKQSPCRAAPHRTSKGRTRRLLNGPPAQDKARSDPGFFFIPVSDSNRRPAQRWGSPRRSAA